ncbi:DoxX family protein [Flavihumibacter petaseus]|uniref:DoxX family protein n=1 Tax=Flavihumibacter petaseus NBRC 106054 TaxID=1220578 RepID=A0A0E9MTG1_9BACT|nr:DoxX family protein [Flavihumibacter petaseus]GAO41047.1 hypothetical protein FPE01S_01_00590 [Flavihumibacter petaseus NBRC 106054]
MKKTKIIYWIFTGLLAALMLSSGIQNFMYTQPTEELFKHLGYPEYVARFLGLAKILAGIGLLIPGYPRLKEWVYAGIFYDLLGAVYSGVSIGDPIVQWLPMLIFFAILFLSYYYHHRLLKERLQAQRT